MVLANRYTVQTLYFRVSTAHFSLGGNTVFLVWSQQFWDLVSGRSL